MFRSGKQEFKFQFNIRIESITGLPNKYTDVRIVLSRGAKIQKTKFVVAKDSQAVFSGNEGDMALVATMLQDLRGRVDRKEYKLQIIRLNSRAQRAERAIGTGILDLAVFTHLDGYKDEVELAVKIPEHKVTAVVKLFIQSIFLKDYKGGDTATNFSALSAVVHEPGESDEDSEEEEKKEKKGLIASPSAKPTTTTTTSSSAPLARPSQITTEKKPDVVKEDDEEDEDDDVFNHRNKSNMNNNNNNNDDDDDEENVPSASTSHSLVSPTAAPEEETTVSLSRKLELAQKELRDAKARLSSRDNELIQLRKAMQSMNDEKKSKKKEKDADARVQLISATNEVAEAKAEISRLKEDISELRNSRMVLDETIQKVTNEKNALEGKIQATTKQYQNTIDEMSQKQMETDVHVQQLLTEIEELKIQKSNNKEDDDTSSTTTTTTAASNNVSAVRIDVNNNNNSNDGSSNGNNRRVDEDLGSLSPVKTENMVDVGELIEAKMKIAELQDELEQLKHSFAMFKRRASVVN